MRALLFYADRLVEIITLDMLTGVSLSRYILTTHGQEIYNGGYVYSRWRPKDPPEWWRCDSTPVLDDHVPKELKLLLLLLN
jgi:hypothetical protein